MLSLGLAPNSDFAIKLLQALDPLSHNKSPEDLKITLQDFIKIFRSNKVSEALLNLIQKETDRRLNINHQPMAAELPSKRFDHPRLNTTIP